MIRDAATDAFVAHRDLLFTTVHELLGSAADAEDVLQETWLRWAHLDVDLVRDRRAELVRIAIRQALARLHEDGQLADGRAGSWLPEAPFFSASGVGEDVGWCDTGSGAALEGLRRAIETGDRRGLLDVLARDVVALTDGSGIENVSIRPVVGAEGVARFIAATRVQAGAEVSTDPVRINGHPALVVIADGSVHGVVAVAIEGSVVTGLYYARSPEAMTGLQLPSTEPSGTLTLEALRLA